VRTTEPKSMGHKKDHYGRAKLLYIDEREIITYAKGLKIEAVGLEFHALPCQASRSLELGFR